MKIAHFGEIVPHGAGMYHTIHDLILAERQVGIDAQFIDWACKKEFNQNFSRVGFVDNGVETVSPSWAKKADVLVRHSAIPPELENSGKPIVFMLHGRPAYTFELEHQGKTSVLNEIIVMSRKPSYRMITTFWKEFFPFWKLVLDEGVVDFGYIPPVVDLEQYTPDGEETDFKQGDGHPNILVMDLWREDINPLKVIIAAAKFIENKCPTGKLHCFGLPNPGKDTAVANVIGSLQKKGIIGRAFTIASVGIEKIYRSADLLVTPHRIATRVIREALASGCPIVAGSGCEYTKYNASPDDMDAYVKAIGKCWKDSQDKGRSIRKEARRVAEEEFNFEQAGQAALKIYEKVLGEELVSKHRKLKIFNFTAYAPEGMDKDLGNTYNDYMKLLPDDAWACFLDHDAMWMTPDWYKQLEEIIERNPRYGCFTCMTNRIGNPEQLVKGVDQDNHDIVYHREIGKKLQSQHSTEIENITNKHCMSGVVMLVKKSAWEKGGGFKEGFLGVDNDFHTRLSSVGVEIGLMKGLYIYHWYRYKDSEIDPLIVSKSNDN